MGDMMKLVFTEEEIKRIKMKGNSGRIQVDLHMLTVPGAKRLLSNLIALDREGREIDVIHGFNHGTRIKDMVWNGLPNPRIAGRRCPEGNPGLTTLTIAAAS